MFLPVTRRRNPALIEAAIQLHRTGRIDPDTYVFDLDAIEANAAALAETGRRVGVGLWFVGKQYGRNPLINQTVAAHLPEAAAIDHREADQLHREGVALGNVGHLVQIPRHVLPRVVGEYRPRFATVYDLENLEAVAAAAHDHGLEQSLLLKIAGPPESTYPGQQGGFTLAELPGVIERAHALPGVRIGGVTGFPCVVFDDAARRPALTAAARTVLEAHDLLRAAGLDSRMSLPSHTSVSTLPLVAEAGASFAEPGHALTGTTPEHAAVEDLAEIPASVYVSEVAMAGPRPSVYGGGFYARGHAHSLLVSGGDGVRQGRLHAHPAENIDYYRGFELDGTGPGPHVGDTAIMSFRTQVFVTRSRVAVVSGIGCGAPTLRGTWTATGERIS